MSLIRPPLRGRAFDYHFDYVSFSYFSFFALFFLLNKKEKAPQTVHLQGFQVVEVAGFEPTTFWSRNKAVTFRKRRYYKASGGSGRF